MDRAEDELAAPSAVERDVSLGNPNDGRGARDAVVVDDK
jgi:hypothetical protein